MAVSKEQQQQFIDRMKAELEAINAEFHDVIDTHGHCYERPGNTQDHMCHCEHYYGKWVETKKKYS